MVVADSGGQYVTILHMSFADSSTTGVSALRSPSSSESASQSLTPPWAASSAVWGLYTCMPALITPSTRLSVGVSPLMRLRGLKIGGW